jgi:hypothetical protein
MTTAQSRTRRLIIPLGIVAVIAAQGVALKLTGIEPTPIVGILMFGAAIVAAAFALAWAGEAAEVDISGGLAVGLLAIIAILPEYAIDLYFAFTAGSDPSQAQYAAANMTGSNRLLLGFGWPFILLVAFLVYLRARRRRQNVDPDVVEKPFAITLPPSNRVELGLLIVASVLTLIIPLTGQIHVLLGVVLLALFAYYLWKVSTGETDDPELVGVAHSIGTLPKAARRATIITIFALSAVIILLLAEPFANSLIAGGRAAGIDPAGQQGQPVDRSGRLAPHRARARRRRLGAPDGRPPGRRVRPHRDTNPARSRHAAHSPFRRAVGNGAVRPIRCDLRVHLGRSPFGRLRDLRRTDACAARGPLANNPADPHGTVPKGRGGELTTTRSYPPCTSIQAADGMICNLRSSIHMRFQCAAYVRISKPS